MELEVLLVRPLGASAEWPAPRLRLMVGAFFLRWDWVWAGVGENRAFLGLAGRVCAGGGGLGVGCGWVGVVGCWARMHGKGVCVYATQRGLR